MRLLEYLVDYVNFPVTEGAISSILSVRGVSGDLSIDLVPVRLRRLCEADLLAWICSGPHRLGAVVDRDNGWEHSDGGFTLSDSDRAYLLGRANAIYKEYGEPLVGGKRVKVLNFGIKRANRGFNAGYAMGVGSESCVTH